MRVPEQFLAAGSARPACRASLPALSSDGTLLEPERTTARGYAHSHD